MSWTAVHDLRALCLIFFSWGTVPENSFPDPLSRFMAHSSWDRWVQEEPNNKFLRGNKAKLQAFFFFAELQAWSLLRKPELDFGPFISILGEEDMNFRPWDFYFLNLLCYSSFLFTVVVCTSLLLKGLTPLGISVWAEPECWGFSLSGRVPNRPTRWRSRR